MSAPSQESRPTSRIVAVTGGRDYRDKATVWRVLDGELATDGVAVLVHGACRSGADAIADDWARERKVNVKRYYANWKHEGLMAGPLRNEHMLRDARPHVLISFPGGKGTADCTGRAELLGIPVLRIQESS